MNKRIYEYDIVRTIATFSVVFVHISAIAIAGYQPDSMPSVLMIFLNRMMKFTTPVFVYLAGALIHASLKKRPFSYGKFLISRGKRILIPYTLISLMYFVLLSLLSHQSLNLVVFFKQWLTGSAQYHLYFIPIILQLYILTPVFLWMKDKVDRKYLTLGLVAVSYLCVILMKFPYSDRIFLKYMVPYTIGLYYGTDIMTWMKNLKGKIIYLIGLTMVVGVYYTMTHTAIFNIQDYYTLEKFRDTGWFFYCILSCFVLTYLAMYLSRVKGLTRLAAGFSKISYYVYLLHPLFIYLTEKLLDKLGIASVSLRFIVTLLIVSVVSTLVAYIIKGMDWHRRYKKLSKANRKRIVMVSICIFVVLLYVSYQQLEARGYIPSAKSFITNQKIEKLQEKNKSSDHVYTNEKFGYTYNFEGFELEDENEVIKTTFINEDTIVDVYYENLTGTIHSAQPFTIYGNRSIKEGRFVTLHEDTWIKLDDYNVHLLSWSRQDLKHVEEDYTHYVSFDIIKNDLEVYNITINSKNSLDGLEYLARFKMIPMNDDGQLNKLSYERIENESWSESTKDYFKQAFIEKDELVWGIFEPSTIRGLDPLNELEEKLGYDFAYLLQYYNLNSYINADNIQAIYDQGKVLEFTLQTSVYGEYNPDATLDVLNGVYDEELNNIAESVSKVNGPVLFRLNNEMNGDWCMYNAFWYQKDTRLYKELWQHIYNLFESKGADNVIWIFNPNESSFPGFKWNHYSNYFPGEEYVDIIGVTGYNTGTYYEGETWRSFEEIYDEFMPEYEEVFLGYPKMITEFGSSTIGGDKSTWMTDMFETIDKYDLKAAIYWNSTDYTPEKEEARIYRFGDDPAVIEVFRRYLNIE